jgi:hypothetical protein
MRCLACLLASMSIAATAPSPLPPRPHSADQAGAPQPVGRICHGRIVAARAERGLPPLQRDNAAPEEPLFIAAVDKQIDGCEVLVMRNDIRDIRPLPEFRDAPGQLRPLR